MGIMKAELTTAVTIVAEGDNTPPVREAAITIQRSFVQVTGIKLVRTAGAVLPSNIYIYEATGGTGLAPNRVLDVSPTADFDEVFLPIAVSETDTSDGLQLFAVVDNNQGATSTWDIQIRIQWWEAD